VALSQNKRLLEANGVDLRLISNLKFLRLDFILQLLERSGYDGYALIYVFLCCLNLNAVIHHDHFGVKMIPQKVLQVKLLVDHVHDLPVISDFGFKVRKQDVFGDLHVLLCNFFLLLIVVNLLVDEISKRLDSPDDFEYLVGNEDFSFVEFSFCIGFQCDHACLSRIRAAGTLDLELVCYFLSKILDDNVSEERALKAFDVGGPDLFKLNRVSKLLQIRGTTFAVDLAAGDLDFVLHLAILVLMLAKDCHVGYLAAELCSREVTEWLCFEVECDLSR